MAHASHDQGRSENRELVDDTAVVADGRRCHCPHFLSSGFFLCLPASTTPVPPLRGQMGVPAYVKAALCSAHPRSAICQCQGASAVSMETPPASRQRRKRASEHERVNEPSGAVGDPRFCATTTPPAERNPGLPPPPSPFSTAGLYHPFVPPREHHPRRTDSSRRQPTRMLDGKLRRFAVSPPSPLVAPEDAYRFTMSGVFCRGFSLMVKSGHGVAF